MPLSNGTGNWVRILIAVATATAGVMLFVWQTQDAQDADIGDNGKDIRVLEQLAIDQKDLNSDIRDDLQSINSSVSAIQIDVASMKATMAAQAADIEELKDDVDALRNR